LEFFRVVSLFSYQGALLSLAVSFQQQLIQFTMFAALCQQLLFGNFQKQFLLC